MARRKRSADVLLPAYVGLISLLISSIILNNWLYFVCWIIRCCTWFNCCWTAGGMGTYWWFCWWIDNDSLDLTLCKRLGTDEVGKDGGIAGRVLMIGGFCRIFTGAGGLRMGFDGGADDCWGLRIDKSISRTRFYLERAIAISNIVFE